MCLRRLRKKLIIKMKPKIKLKLQHSITILKIKKYTFKCKKYLFRFILAKTIKNNNKTKWTNFKYVDVNFIRAGKQLKVIKIWWKRWMSSAYFLSFDPPTIFEKKN